MKKTLILALSLAAPVFAGEPVLAPAPIVTPAPAACCPLTLELAGVYNYANTDIFSHSDGTAKDIDTYGVDLTAVYALSERHSVNLRFGYTFGDEANRANGLYEETDVHTFYLMPGYRYTRPITEKVSAYAGINVGIANMSVKHHWRVGNGAHDSEFGLAYSAEIGLRYELCECCELFAAYQFSGSTATPHLEVLDTHQQHYNGARVGVSFKF